MARQLRLIGPLAALAATLTFVAIGHTEVSHVRAVSTHQDSARRGPDKMDTVTRLSSSGSAVIALSEKRVRVPLESSATSHEGRVPAARLPVPSSPHRLYLVIRDLQAVSQPGTLFHIYLDLPDGVTPTPKDPRHVGSMNFFNAIREPRGTQTTNAGSRSVDESHDITEVVKRLKAKRLLADHASVTIIATKIPESASTPTIGRIEVVEQ